MIFSLKVLELEQNGWRHCVPRTRKHGNPYQNQVCSPIRTRIMVNYVPRKFRLKNQNARLRFWAFIVGISKCGLHHWVPWSRKPTCSRNHHASICYSSWVMAHWTSVCCCIKTQNSTYHNSRTITDRSMGIAATGRFNNLKNLFLKCFNKI